MSSAEYLEQLVEIRTGNGHRQGVAALAALRLRDMCTGTLLQHGEPVLLVGSLGRGTQALGRLAVRQLLLPMILTGMLGKGP